MNTKLGRGYAVFQVFNYIFLLAFSLVMLYPLIYAFAISFSDPFEVLTGKVRFLIRGFNIDAYKLILSSPELGVSYKNTVLYTILGTVITVVISILAAYPLSLKRMKGKSFFMFIFTITMFFNGGMIPTFLVVKSLGLLGSMWSVILTPAFHVFYIIILRTSFMSIPESLGEAAYIDGANDLVILLRIVLPLSKAMIATIALFAAVLYWNDFFNALLYLSETNKFPLTIMLRKIFFGEIQNQAFNKAYLEKGMMVGAGFVQSIRMATVIVTLLPILLVYPFVQKYFVKGVMIGSVKG